MKDKILVVEDEEEYLSLLSAQLTKRGYDVLQAKNGAEGLQVAIDKKPDLILLDLIMPKVGGLQMLSALRKFQWGAKVPVFVLTNVNGSSEISAAMNNTVSKYLVKADTKLETLLADIDIFLQHK